MHFSKMHGLGNDFIIIDAITQKIHITTEKIKLLSNRHLGIGCDQLLIVEPSNNTQIDFHCRIYNAEGTEVNQCGNGMRCLAQFVYKRKLTNKHDIKISIGTNNTVKLSIINNHDVSVNMGIPIFNPEDIPFYALQYQKNYILFLPTQTILCGVVSVGNPHCVILVESIEKTELNKLGALLENHHRFPNKANISFMQIINSNTIKLKVYERNVGETQACGSAACAAVVIGIQLKLLKKTVKVNFPGGILSINWKGIHHPLYMTGSTTYIYDGFFFL